MGRHGTIAGRKAAQDSKRAAMFTKYARAITVAAKDGGDPEYNSSLRLAIEKAKAISMPNDNITRAIKKGTGELAGETYVELKFEGYGVAGVAVIVEALTDNRNRTAGEMRHLFDKFGGNLGQSGSVGFMFDRKGVIVIEKNDKIDEDELMMMALDAGAEDFTAEEEYYEILTAPNDFSKVREELAKNSLEFAEAEIKYIPQTTTVVGGDDAVKLERLIDALEDNDDVQNVYHNWEIEE
jgi:YebC/PmpR family DNA-binding regulatory protein